MKGRGEKEAEGVGSQVRAVTAGATLGNAGRGETGLWSSSGTAGAFGVCVACALATADGASIVAAGVCTDATAPGVDGGGGGEAVAGRGVWARGVPRGGMTRGLAGVLLAGAACIEPAEC